MADPYNLAFMNALDSVVAAHHRGDYDVPMDVAITRATYALLQALEHDEMDATRLAKVADLAARRSGVSPGDVSSGSMPIRPPDEPR